MRSTVFTATLLMALASGSSQAQNALPFAGQAIPLATGYAPGPAAGHTAGSYEHPALDDIAASHNGTLPEFRETLEGMYGKIAAGLNELLNAELERDLQQRGTPQTAGE